MDLQLVAIKGCVADVFFGTVGFVGAENISGK